MSTDILQVILFCVVLFHIGADLVEVLAIYEAFLGYFMAYSSKAGMQFMCLQVFMEALSIG